jgi:hypothetical protein
MLSSDSDSHVAHGITVCRASPRAEGRGIASPFASPWRATRAAPWRRRSRREACTVRARSAARPHAPAPCRGCLRRRARRDARLPLPARGIATRWVPRVLLPTASSVTPSAGVLYRAQRAKGRKLLQLAIGGPGMVAARRGRPLRCLAERRHTEARHDGHSWASERRFDVVRHALCATIPPRQPHRAPPPAPQ